VLRGLLLLVTPWVSPNARGSAFIAAQAIVALMLAFLAWRALGGSAFAAAR